MIVGIIGAGAWGTALSYVSARSGNQVILWSYDGMYKEFEGTDMPQGIKIQSLCIFAVHNNSICR